LLLWEHEETQRILSFLEPNKQFVLNSYFATGKPGLSDEEALAYRKTRSNSEAFSAGKAFNELIRIIDGTRVKTRPRVAPLVRPEIDAKLYAQALVNIVKNQNERRVS
jgi:hypothetical protein